MEVAASRFSSSKESAPYTMFCEGDVHSGVLHWWGNTLLRRTSKEDDERCLLLYAHAALPLFSAQEKSVSLCGKEPYHSSCQCKESHRYWYHGPLCYWQWEILEHPTYSFYMSLCIYDLFAKVTEPPRVTWYNTRDELIRDMGRSVMNINKAGLADVVWRLPNIWQNVDMRGRVYWKYINVKPLWIRLCQKYLTVAITFYPTLVFARIES